MDRPFRVRDAGVARANWPIVVRPHLTVTMSPGTRCTTVPPVMRIDTNGWITLTGTLDWHYQKNAAARTIRDLMGVKGVTDDIVVRPQVKTLDVRDKIEAAFKRSAEVDARRISVVAEDGKV